MNLHNDKSQKYISPLNLIWIQSNSSPFSVSRHLFLQCKSSPLGNNPRFSFFILSIFTGQIAQKPVACSPPFHSSGCFFPSLPSLALEEGRIARAPFTVCTWKTGGHERGHRLFHRLQRGGFFFHPVSSLGIWSGVRSWLDLWALGGIQKGGGDQRGGWIIQNEDGGGKRVGGSRLYWTNRRCWSSEAWSGIKL